MKKEKIRTIIKRTKNSKIKTKSKPDNTTENIKYDFTLLEEIFKGAENRKFIRTELKRIAEDYKIPESTVALYAGKRFIWQDYCSKESGYALEKLEGDELLDEIMNIADSKESEKEFDWKAFFQGVDGDLMEDFAIIQLPKLPIWDELLEYLEAKENQKNKNN
ncbi:hypothetical protein SAMN04487775_107223 [Treponema bryantii]|uniref:Uncharacterized protein n=1 Tax=Treponema bryantii TaxID=163 RepID=A0A1I3LW99_9SPIR|nr:hypothetical protein [Treponema bryantii]SFI88840.1 hypothetical protein SAMN04487775_107223 [Treponema bryantii]